MLLWKLDGVLGGGKLFLLLAVLGIVGVIGLIYDKRFDSRRLWNAEPIGRAMGWIVLQWAILSAVLVGVFGLMSGRELAGLSIAVPTRLFGLFQLEGWLLLIPLAIALGYPCLSVYPQNVIYRAFFCHRYEPILGRGWSMVLVSATMFSLCHVIFNNWVVLVLTFVGGILFTRTYLKHQSLLLSVIEHTMYGLLCFYLGVGLFLRYGAVS